MKSIYAKWAGFHLLLIQEQPEPVGNPKLLHEDHPAKVHMPLQNFLVTIIRGLGATRVHEKARVQKSHVAVPFKKKS